MFAVTGTAACTSWVGREGQNDLNLKNLLQVVDSWFKESGERCINAVGEYNYSSSSNKV